MPTFCLTLLRLFFFLAPLAAHADSGELVISAVVDQEWSMLRHPYHDLRGPAPTLSLYVPRFGAALTYGLHNRFSAGIAGRASLRGSGWAAVNRYTYFDPSSATEFFVTTRDALATAFLRWTAFDGDTLFIDVGMEGGASFRKWQATQYRSANEPPTSLSATVDHQLFHGTWKTSPYVRASVAVRARPWQFLSLAIAPYVASTLTKDIAVGACLEVGSPIGVGPGV